MALVPATLEVDFEFGGRLVFLMPLAALGFIG
jgi:hypothetical protein